MYENGKIYMGLAGDKRVELALNMCNRHGLIAGGQRHRQDRHHEGDGGVLFRRRCAGVSV